MTTIYVLVDPTSGLIRYVGKTVKLLPRRLREHLRDKSDCRRTRWIKKLGRSGVKPAIREIEQVPVGGDWAAAERRWIAQLRRTCDLTNCTDGGEGAPGRKVSKETRDKIGKGSLGLRRSQETKDKLSEIARNRSPETRQKLGDHLRGTVRTPQYCANMSKILKGKMPKGDDHHNVKLSDNDVDTILTRLQAGEGQRALAREYGVCHSLINAIRHGRSRKRELA